MTGQDCRMARHPLKSGPVAGLAGFGAIRGAPDQEGPCTARLCAPVGKYLVSAKSTPDVVIRRMVAVKTTEVY